MGLIKRYRALEKRTLLGDLYEFHEETGEWFSYEEAVPGTVRVIENKLHYAESDILLGEVGFCNQTRDTRVTRWKLFTNL